MSSLSSKKQMKTSREVVKSNLFVRPLEENSAWKNHFEFFWPLAIPLKMCDFLLLFGSKRLLKMNAAQLILFTIFENKPKISKQISILKVIRRFDGKKAMRFWVFAFNLRVSPSRKRSVIFFSLFLQPRTPPFLHPTYNEFIR